MKKLLFLLALVPFLAQAQTGPWQPNQFASSRTKTASPGYFDARGWFRVPVKDTTFVPDSIGQLVFRPQDTLLYSSVSITGPRFWSPVGKRYRFSNGLTETPGHTNLVELGGSLDHNTNLNTVYNKLTLQGAMVYDYPYQFQQLQYFQAGTGIVSFLSAGSQVKARLGINYTDTLYQAATDTSGRLPGYFGDKNAGYFLGTNTTGNGSFGLKMDDTASKSAGVFFHTRDTSKRAVSVYGVRKTTDPYQLLDTAMIASFDVDKNIRFYGYPSTRTDGVAPKALYTDALGNLRLGTIPTYNGGNFIENRTTEQPTSNFYISGTGTATGRFRNTNGNNYFNTAGGSTLLGYADGGGLPGTYKLDVFGRTRVTGTFSGTPSDAAVMVTPTITPPASNWDASTALKVAPVLNATANWQANTGVEISPTWNTNGFTYHPDVVPSALQINTRMQGISINQNAQPPGSTAQFSPTGSYAGQPILILQTTAVTNKEAIRLSRSQNHLNYAPFIYLNDSRDSTIANQMVPVIRWEGGGVNSYVRAGGGISIQQDRRYYGRENSLEMYYLQDVKGNQNAKTGIHLRPSNTNNGLRVIDGGNVLVNTSTYAGYKFDIAGTLRVTDSVTLSYLGTSADSMVLVRTPSGKISMRPLIYGGSGGAPDGNNYVTGGTYTGDTLTLTRLSMAPVQVRIPEAVNADWNATTGLAQILNKPDLSVFYTKAQMQTSGSAELHWDNITNKPTILTSESDPQWTLDKPGYYTNTNLQTVGQAIVDWGNIANAPADANNFPSSLAISGLDVTLGRTGLSALTARLDSSAVVTWPHLDKTKDSLVQLINTSAKRFGVSGEDALGTANRLFNTQGNWFQIVNRASGTGVIVNSLTVNDNVVGMTTSNNTKYSEVNQGNTGVNAYVNIEAGQYSDIQTIRVADTAIGVTVTGGRPLRVKGLSNLSTGYVLNIDPVTSKVTYAPASGTDANAMHLTGNETAAGNKTFSNLVGIGSAPSYPFHVEVAAPADVTSGNGTAAASYTLYAIGQQGGNVNATTGTVQGAQGSKFNFIAGRGGSVTGTPTSGTGGNGGNVDLYAGDGGSGTTQGGQGGKLNLAAGSGGNGTTSGQGGHIYIKGGMAGITGPANGGSIYLVPGAKNGTGVDGDIFLGTSGGANRGNVKIGDNITPTARLEIVAGTATLPPLKINAGTNTTTPQDGAVEYDGTHAYFTVGSTRYQLDQQTAGYATTASLDNYLPLAGGNMSGTIKVPSTVASPIEIYNTTDQTTNYERYKAYWSGNVYNMLVDQAGTGVARVLKIGTNSGGTAIAIDASGGVKYDFTSNSNASAGGIGFRYSGAYTASSGTQSFTGLFPTINQTSTAGYRGLWISPYEQTTGSGSKLLIDAGTNTAANGSGTHTSKFTVDNTGITIATSFVKSGGTASQILKADGSTTTATTVGTSFLTGANPSAITFPRINADNTVSFVDAATFRTAIGADDFTLRNSLTTGGTQLMWNKTTNESVIRAIKSANGNLTISNPDDSTTLLTVTASSYTLPTASATTLGGVKVGTGLAIDGSGVLSTTSSGGVTIDSVATLGDITSANARHFLFVGSKRDFYFHAGDSLVQITKTMVALPPPAATAPTGTAATFTLATGTQDFAQSTSGSDVLYNTQLDWARNVSTNTIPAATNGRLMAQYLGTPNLQAMLALSVNSTRDMADVASSGNFWCYVYDAGSGVIKLYGDYENYTNATPSGSRPTMQVGDWYGLYRDGTTGNVKLQYWRSVANGGTGNWVDVQTFTATTTALMYRKISAYGTSSITRRITNPKYQ